MSYSNKKIPLTTHPSELPPPPGWLVIHSDAWGRDRHDDEGSVRHMADFDKVRKRILSLYKKNQYHSSKGGWHKVENPTAEASWKVYEWVLDPSQTAGGYWLLHSSGTQGDLLSDHAMLAKRRPIRRKAVADDEVAAVLATIQGLAPREVS